MLIPQPRDRNSLAGRSISLPLTEIGWLGLSGRFLSQRLLLYRTRRVAPLVNHSHEERLAFPKKRANRGRRLAPCLGFARDSCRSSIRERTAPLSFPERRSGANPSTPWSVAHAFGGALRHSCRKLVRKTCCKGVAPFHLNGLRAVVTGGNAAFIYRYARS